MLRRGPMITVNGDAFTTEVNGTSAVTLECTENKTSRVTRKFHSESVSIQKIKETKNFIAITRIWSSTDRSGGLIVLNSRILRREMLKSSS